MERIYHQGTQSQNDCAFRALSARNPKAALVQGSGGLLPELCMLDQIVYPGLIAGRARSGILSELQAISPVPLHRLRDLPGRSNRRIRAWAVLLRLLIQRSETIVINGFFDEHPALLPQFVELLPEDTTLYCLGTCEPPDTINWTAIHKGGIL